MVEPAIDHPYLAEVDAYVRRAVYDAFARGDVPSRADVATRTGLDMLTVADSYERLAAAKVLVLQPDTREIWMAMPFSAIPTAFCVEGARAAWWANCAWDALGVPVALDADARINTECAQSGQPITLVVKRGELQPSDCVVHFAVPASQWWDDIGFT